MINKVNVTNYGPVNELNWEKLGNINLVIGKNSCGKTFLLKMLYSAVKTLEEYKRGDDKRSASDILVDKLFWTFQVDAIGDLVTKNADSALKYSMEFDNKSFHYSFGKDTTKKIPTLENHVDPRSSNSVFLPAKEVLSIFRIIQKTRDIEKLYGFDDTYYDLMKALQLPPKKGKNMKIFSDARRSLAEIIEGKVEYDEKSLTWQYKKGNQKFNIGVTAEGVKKIAILDTLLCNRFLDKDSIIFIDEPESALHPQALTKFLDIIYGLSKAGVQVFMASHSYFVIKKLFLIAQKYNLSIPVISAENNNWETSDLLHDMPDNPIIQESIRLYQEEVEVALK